jgi:hypothetical protein
MGWMVWGSNPSGGKIFHTHSGWHWGSPGLYILGTGAFLGAKRPVRGTDCPLPSNAQVKEGVELYLYSLSGPSWPVLGWTLHLILIIEPLTQFHPVTMCGSVWIFRMCVHNSDTWLKVLLKFLEMKISFKAANCCNQQEQISIYSLSGTRTWMFSATNTGAHRRTQLWKFSVHLSF